MALLGNKPPLRVGRELLQLTSATIDELAQLHFATCARFAERNVDGVAGLIKAKDFNDFVTRQRRQYQELLDDRETYLASVSEIVHRAVVQANELWSNPPAATALREPLHLEGKLAPSANTTPPTGRTAQANGTPHANEATQSSGTPQGSKIPRATETRTSDEARQAHETRQGEEPLAASESPRTGPAFALCEDQAGTHRFRLISGDGSELLISKAYKSQKSARNGIAAVRKNAGNDARYERFETDSGMPMFNLKGGNHQVIATSRPYPSAADMENAVEMVKTDSATAEIVDD